MLLVLLTSEIKVNADLAGLSQQLLPLEIYVASIRKMLLMSHIQSNTLFLAIRLIKDAMEVI